MASVRLSDERISNVNNPHKTTYNYDDAFKASIEYFGGDDLAAKVFLDKYALRDSNQNLLEQNPDQMHWRIAKEFARVEKGKFSNPMSENEIYSYLEGFNYIVPQGSPMYGIGNDNQIVSLSNCYVIPSPLDSYGSIMKTDEELVQVSKRRGGNGTDLSNLRPSGAYTRNAARSSTGVISFAERYSNSIREVGQCLHGSTEVLTKNGLVPIRDIEEGDSVWTENSWSYVNNIITNTKDTVKVKTKSGLELICSEDHVVHTKHGERKVNELNKGDSVTSIVGQEWYGENIYLDKQKYKRSDYNNSNRLNESVYQPEILTPELAYLLGYAYGDGYVEKHSKNNSNTGLSLACSNDWTLISDKLQQIIKDQYNLDVQPTHKKSQGDMHSLRLHSRIVLDHFAYNNLLKQKAGELVFPDILLNAKTDVIFGFISGYFDADGSAIQSKKTYKFSSIDNEFLQKIQRLLFSFGIYCVIHEDNRNEKGWRSLYTLVINGPRSQQRFSELCSESLKVKSINWQVKNRDCTRTIYSACDYNTKASRHSYIIDNKQQISYSTSAKLCEEIGLVDNYCLLEDQIESIEDYENNSKVFDLCLNHTNFFSANGLYVHNSGRRGALMLTLSVHHPEVTDFATVKQNRQKVTGANISVRLSDEFLNAVINDEKYELRWPIDARENGEEPKISKMVNAREVWQTIVKNARDHAEPGLLLWDNILRENPAECYDLFQSTSTNPCSEINLTPYDSCRLLLQNLLSFVKNPWTKDAYFDFDQFYKVSQVAQRLMDDLVDLETEKIDQIIQKIDKDPEPEDIKRNERDLWIKIREKCIKGRRTGTGVTAVGDVIAALGQKYGSDESISTIEKIYKTLKLGCYRSSVDMAKELRPFEGYDAKKEENCDFIKRIKHNDEQLYKDMVQYGRRNIALLTTAPAGSVSIETQTTSGIEPLFMPYYKRRKKVNPNDENARVDFVDETGDSWQEFMVFHNQFVSWANKQLNSDIHQMSQSELDEIFEESPWYQCCAQDLDWNKRVELQARANKHVDHSISSTLNLPEDVTTDQVKEIYETAWKKGVKGVTIYRDGCRSGVLVKDQNQNEVDKDGYPTAIIKTDAPKRPQSLPVTVHHTTVKGEKYFVLVGLYEDEPYEVFAGQNGFIPKSVKEATVTKKKRGHYEAELDNGEVISNITEYISDDQESVTRLVSASLRHGADLSHVVHQLEKARGDMQSFSKAISRCLKKHVPDGSNVSGESCPSCGQENLQRKEGCVSCVGCGWSRCG